jgi:hypothetical protein
LQADARRCEVRNRESSVRLLSSGRIHHHRILILDNYGAHKAPRVRRWFSRHSRFHLHFTPTSAS